MARNALGRGLGALIRELDATPPPPTPSSTVAPPPTAAERSSVAASFQVDIDLIDPSPFQPRTRFAEAPLKELAQSIRSSGIIQPLVVRRIGGRYQIIAGERRWRASQLAELHRVPVVVREVSDEEAMELTLVENIQREDLNPIELASAFERLMVEFHLTQEEVASRTGKERTTVANTLRLLTLDPQIVQMLGEGKITAGHGRALLGVENPKLRNDLAQKAARGKLTVRQLERQATRRARGRAEAAPAPAQDPNRRAAIAELEQHLGTRVWLHMPEGKRPGQLILDFYDEEQLHGLWEKLVG